MLIDHHALVQSDPFARFTALPPNALSRGTREDHHPVECYSSQRGELNHHPTASTPAIHASCGLGLIGHDLSLVWTGNRR